MLDDDCTKLTKHKAKGLSHPKSTEGALLEGNLFVTKSTCHTLPCFMLSSLTIITFHRTAWQQKYIKCSISKTNKQKDIIGLPASASAASEICSDLLELLRTQAVFLQRVSWNV